MILFNDVVQIFPSPDFDVRLVFLVVAFDRRRIGAALVDRDLLWHAILTDRPAQKAQRRFAIPLGRQQEIHRSAGLVDGSI